MILTEQLWGAGTDADERTDEPTARAALRRRFAGDTPPLGYVTGKTQMRNAIAEQTGCSLAHAETLLERMEQKGEISYEGDHFSAERFPASWKVA